MKEPRVVRGTIGALFLGALLATGAAASLLNVAGDGLDASNADLQLWLRADTGVSTTGSSVDSWTDQSANGYVFNSVDGYDAPELVSSSSEADGNATIKFTSGIIGTNNVGPTGDKYNEVGEGTPLRCDSTGLIPATVTHFLVLTMTPLSNSYNLVFSADRNETGLDRVRKQISLDSRTTVSAGRYPLTYYGRLGSSDSNAYLGEQSGDTNVLTGEMGLVQIVTDVSGNSVSLDFNYDDTLPRVDGTAQNTATESATWLGTGVLGNYGINAEVAEWIIFDRVLTDQEANEVGNYLQERYDIPGNYIPEPSVALLLGLGGLALARFKRQR